MSGRIWDLIQRLFLFKFDPDASSRTYLDRGQTQTSSDVDVTIAIPNRIECERLFGVPILRKGLQPVYIRVVNRSSTALRMHFRSIDPHYFPPLEAAARCHYSTMRRLSAFGAVAWLFYFPLMLFAPLKLISVYWANQKMDSWFQSLGFHRRPIRPGQTSDGFVFTALDVGVKLVRVRLLEADGLPMPDNTEIDEMAEALAKAHALPSPKIDLSFAIQVPGIQADYHHRDVEQKLEGRNVEDCNLSSLVAYLRTVPPAVSNHQGTGHGDPVNLVVIGDFDTVLTAFSARWDETEIISLETCWKTAKAFILGSEYRYSPVSPLYLFGRCQDIALQQIRHSISARLHLRLWLAPVTFQKKPVWVGQVSRDIGVRFTTKAWNLTTHRIDPDVDESRDYVLEDLLDAERVIAAGYLDVSDPCTAESPRHNLTGDPYYTDGKRVAILIGPHLSTPRFVAWS